MPSRSSSQIMIIQPARKYSTATVIASSSTIEIGSSSRSAAKKGCQTRNSPKCTSNQILWKFSPGCEKSAACSASSMAITTQRGSPVSCPVRRCASLGVGDGSKVESRGGGGENKEKRGGAPCAGPSAFRQCGVG